MADPHHVEELDGFDRMTVRSYRLGIAIAAAGVAALTLELALGVSAPGRWLVLGGVAAIAANLHLYDKRIRWLIAAAAWVGAVVGSLPPLLPPGPAGLAADAGLGFQYVTLSGVALKEQFCFRLPWMQAVPILLASSLLPLVLGLPSAAAALSGAAAALLGMLALAKAGMPLHFDIGDRSRYQI